MARGPGAMRVLPCPSVHPGVQPQCQHRSGCQHHRCCTRRVSACGSAGVSWFQTGHTGIPSSSGQAQWPSIPWPCHLARSLGAAHGWVSGRSQLALAPLNLPCIGLLPAGWGSQVPAHSSQTLLPECCGVPGLPSPPCATCGWEGERPRGWTLAPGTIEWPEGPSRPPSRLPSPLRQGCGAEGDLDAPPSGARARWERLLFTVS